MVVMFGCAFGTVLCRNRFDRAILLCVLIIGVLPFLALRGLQGLAPTHVGATSTIAELVTDPEDQQGGGVVVVVRVDHKRLRATAYGAVGAALRSGTAGTRYEITGAAHEWVGSIPGWAVSKHLAGKLNVRSATLIDHGSWPWVTARWIRQRMADGARSLPPSQRPLFGGFVLGDDRGQRPEVTDDFRASGLSHLLVVSGQNVAFVLAATMPLFQRMSPRVRAAAALFCIISFAVITRFEPSVLRASMMAGLAVTSRALYRPQPAIRLVSVAVLGLLLIDPLLSWSIGFGLSVGATVGLALLSGPIEKLLTRRLTSRWLPRWIRSALSATLAAQIGTYPLLVGLGGVSPLSIPANLLALPAAEPLMIWGLIIGVPAGLLGHAAATVLHVPDRLLIGWVAAVAKVAAMFVRHFPTAPWWPAVVVGVVFVHHIAQQITQRVVRKMGLHGRICRNCVHIGFVVLMTVGLWWSPVDSREQVLLSHGRVTLWRNGGSVVVFAKPGVDGLRTLADLRLLRVTAIDAIVMQRSTNSSWTSVGPLLARFRPRLLVQCGRTTKLDGIEVFGVGEGDVLHVSSNSRDWLLVRCVNGRANVET
jgi:competence protein ComEC